jgi:hypothetical protein
VCESVKVVVKRERDTLNLPILFSKPFEPPGISVGITIKYVRHVANTHLPSSVTSMPIIGSPKPGRFVFARGLRSSIEVALYPRPSPKVFESKSLISPRFVPTATAPVSVVAAQL